VVAVVRHQDARLLGGLDDGRPLGHAHRHALDGQVDEIRAHSEEGAREMGSLEDCRTPSSPAPSSLAPLFRYSSNSDLNFLIPLTIGAAQLSLSTQIVLPVIWSERSRRRSRSSGLPWPRRIRSRMRVVQAVPSRHWVHWAQLSWA